MEPQTASQTPPVAVEADGVAGAAQELHRVVAAGHPALGAGQVDRAAGGVHLIEFPSGIGERHGIPRTADEIDGVAAAGDHRLPGREVHRTTGAVHHVEIISGGGNGRRVP